MPSEIEAENTETGEKISLVTVVKENGEKVLVAVDNSGTVTKIFFDVSGKRILTTVHRVGV
jgi:hypothetical protein